MTEYQQLSLIPLLEEEWFVLTMYEPFPSLMLAGIKEFETRPKGVRTKLPLRLFLQAARQKMIPRDAQLARKYLGANFKPQYGKIIATEILTEVIVMTSEVIAKQNKTELDVGNWKPDRNAWRIKEIEALPTPVAAIGNQAAPWNLDKSKDNPDLRRRILEVWAPPLIS